MSYSYHEQTRPGYKNIKYGQGTVYSSGCGPASLCNALDAMGIASVTVKDMCAYSVSVGARVSGGTDMFRLLDAAAKKYGITYTITSSNAKLLQHLKNGGAAIVHAGSEYPLFSTSGHFLAAVAASGNDVTILDSYWYDSKYTGASFRKNAVKVLQRGIIRANITQVGKATADRSPSYYLLSKVKTDTKKQPVAAVETEEDDDMIKYKTVDDVPAWGKETVQKLLDKGYLTGSGTSSGKAVINLTESMLRMMVINDRAGLYQ